MCALVNHMALAEGVQVPLRCEREASRAHSTRPSVNGATLTARCIVRGVTGGPFESLYMRTVIEAPAVVAMAALEMVFTVATLKQWGSRDEHVNPVT